MLFASSEGNSHLAKDKDGEQGQVRREHARRCMSAETESMPQTKESLEKGATLD